MKSILAYPAIGLIYVYKYTLSPALSAIGIRCRHTPSCSCYGIQAMEKHGFWAGGWMTLARLLRCHPFERLGATSGVDNVPESITKPPFWAPWRYGVWRLKNDGQDDGQSNIS